MLNRAEIIGRLCHAPSIRYTTAGDPVCNMSVATNEKWTGKDGQKHEEAEFHNVVCFGKLAGICEQYLDKGSQVYLAGKLKTSSWDDKNNGAKRYKTEIIANEMEMLGSKPAADNEIPAKSAADIPGSGQIPF